MLRFAVTAGVLVFVSCPAVAQVVVAHRGASFDAPENTIAAVREAWRQNADGIEADFRLTKDDQIVCMHDADTKRTGGKKLVVRDSTLAELRALEYGSWKDPGFRGEPIPTFAEVLAEIPQGKLFVVELKTGPEIVPLLKVELDRLNPDPAQLWIIAFDVETVIAAKRTFPAIRTHWLTGYKQDKVTGQWSPAAANVLDTLKQSGADGLGTQGNRKVVDGHFLDALKSGQLREFHVWTIDEPADAVFYQSQGAIGITTNRPGLILNAIQPARRR